MAAVATPAQAVDSLHTLAAQALAAGYPATLFGYTPEQREYWYEPGLPWFKAEMFQEHPLDNREGTPAHLKGWSCLPCIGEIAGDQMAPRFPRGSAVNTMPVHRKEHLAVGKVYTYRFRNPETGQEDWNIGRLVKIGGNFLEVKADTDSQPSIWLLREEGEQATWDVREVTHYASYPGEDR